MTHLKNKKGVPLFDPCLDIEFFGKFIVIFTIGFVPVSISAINLFSFVGTLYWFKLPTALFMLIESKACI